MCYLSPLSRLLDVLAALEWVQRNIGAFGGDAAQVGGAPPPLLPVPPYAAPQ